MWEFFGNVGCLLKTGVKLCSWDVNEVLHYVDWQVTQNGTVWLVSMILEAFSYMSWCLIMLWGW